MATETAAVEEPTAWSAAATSSVFPAESVGKRDELQRMTRKERHNVRASTKSVLCRRFARRHQSSMTNNLAWSARTRPCWRAKPTWSIVRVVLLGRDSRVDGSVGRYPGQEAMDNARVRAITRWHGESCCEHTSAHAFESSAGFTRKREYMWLLWATAMCFLSGATQEERIFLEPPPEAQVSPDYVWAALCAFPGLKGAPKAWEEHSAQQMGKLGMNPGRCDGCMFQRKSDLSRAGRPADDFILTSLAALKPVLLRPAPT